MQNHRTRLLGSLLSLLVGGVLFAGCGDDDDNDASGTTGGKTSQGGVGGSAGISGGKSTGGSGGGTSKGGSAGLAGSDDGSGAGNGGAAAAGQSNGAGSSGESGAGGQGEGGSGGGAPVAAIEKLSAAVSKGVNDLRGLTFSSDSSMIYASGHRGVDTTTTDRELVVLRASADGELDPTFGVAGILTMNLVERQLDTVPEPDVVLNDGNEQSLGIVELANGDLVVQANVRDVTGKGQDVVLLRLNSKGERVTSFGTNGIQRIDFGWTPADQPTWTLATGPTDEAWGIALDTSAAQEKIVVFGHGPARLGQTSGTPALQRTDNDRYVARVLAATGALDTGFNGGSVFALNTGGTFSDGARRGIVEPDGSIASCGYTNYGDGLGNHIVLLKLRPNGTPDADFGFGIALPGVARANPFLDDGGVAECYGVAKQSTGRYVTTGYGRATAAGSTSKYGYAPTTEVDLVSFGLLPSGLDMGFGREGTLAIQSEEFALGNAEDRGRDLLVLDDDRIVYVGRFGPHPAIMVTGPDGELGDGVENTGTLLYTALGNAAAVPPVPTSHFYRVAASPDGRRIAATTSNHVDGVLLAVLRIGDE